MISQTAEYALRAIVFLADRNDVPQTTAQIAEETFVPVNYLAKVMQSLSKAKVVHAQRGPNGGFVLAKPGNVMTVLEVINAVDPIHRFPECPLKLPHHGKNLCPLHRKLDDTALMAEQAFGSTTISSLLDVPQTRKPLCRFPLAPKES
ncbi:MAG: transcriptional regulator, BadM/Rrf2 family [Planctomycetaceae bacterium]|nr:transcriptional regulator, BadM/Rrf2 family [Planctomycetaceae bacterium]